MSDPFADIPSGQPTPDKPKGAFDDIPDNSNPVRKAVAAAGSDPFADIPVTEKPKSNPKQYWDATKKKFTDILGDVKAGFGDKNQWELMKTESLPAHLLQGTQREADDLDYSFDDNGGLVATSTAKPKDKSDKTDPGIVEDLKAMGITAKDHPGILVGSLAKSIVADPELLLPWLWEAIPEATAARVAQAAKAMGASVDIAKAAEVGGRVAGRMGVGGAVSAGVEGANQFATGDFDAGAIGKSSAEGAVMSIPGRMGKKPLSAAERRAAGEAELAEQAKYGSQPKTPHEEAVAAGVAQPVQGDLFTPAEAAAVAKVPEERLTAMDSSRESIAQATKEDPINPEMIAEVAKDPIRPPKESRDRLVKAVKQAAAGGAIGAGVGYAVANKTGQDETIGAETGAILGVGLPLLKARRFNGADVSELINARNGQVKSVARHIYQFQHQVEKAVPLKADREKIARMIDGGVEPEHGTPEHDAWRNIKDFFGDMGQVAKEAGVIDQLRENYISHIVVDDPAKKAGFIQRMFGGSSDGSGNTKGGKAFNKERKYDTFEELNAAIKDSGLKVKTEDASEIAGIYGNAVYKSIADKRLLDALKETRLADGTALVVPVAEAPNGYVRMANPQLAGVAVHPDIAPDMSFVWNHKEPNAVMRKLNQITSIAKRTAVSASLFHAKTLMEGYVVASGGSVTPVRAAKAALKMYREGGNNDVVDKLIKGGLQIGTPEDVAGHEIQHGLDNFSDFANARWPLRYTGLGAAAKGIANLDRALERFTFGFLQTGFKINVASSEYERLIGRGVEASRASRIASSMANDIFGSLDYYRVATDTDSHIMRKIGTASLNSNSRKIMQLALFAPDWTMATFRSMAKAMPGGAAEAEAVQTHRRYLIKAAIYYFTVGNAVNSALSGHSLFSNNDPTRVDFGDGRTMQFSKHETEPLEWLRDPMHTAENKLAVFPGTANKIWKSHQRAADSFGRTPKPTPVDDMKLAAEGLEPISIQQFIQNGMTKESLLGAIGFPVYGHKAEDKPKKHKKNEQTQTVQ